MNNSLNPSALVALVRTARERHGDEHYIHTLSTLSPVSRIVLLLLEARADLEEVAAILAMSFQRKEPDASLWVDARAAADRMFKTLLPQVRHVLVTGAGPSIVLGEIAYRGRIQDLPLAGQIVTLMFEAADEQDTILDFLACLHLVQIGHIPLEDHMRNVEQQLATHFREILQAFSRS